MSSVITLSRPFRLARRLPSAVILLVVLALWLLATIGLRPLLLPDEGRYASVAWELLNGDGLVPTLDGLPFFHKPPLAYWIGAAAMRLGAAEPWAVRLAPALGAWLMGVSMWLLMRRWHGERMAAIGLLALATSPFFFVGAQYVNHDMLVAGLISVAIVGWLLALDSPGRIDRRALLAGWIASALACLAKGLIGIVLPVLVVVPWLLAQRRWQDALRLANLPSLLAWAVVALPWPVAMQAHFPAFFDYFIVAQHFRRYNAGGFNNVQPFWFFIAALPLLTVPWSLFAPALVRRLRVLAPVASAERARIGLWAWWAAAVLMFFSLPSSKLIGYALPALPGWIALLALVAGTGRHWRAAALVGATAGLATVLTLAWQAPKSNRDVGLALRDGLRQGDRVVFVDAPFYDVPFYARLTTPPTVASRWDDPGIARRDNWQRELLDAAGFAAPDARLRLWPLQRLGELPCIHATTWFVLRPGDAALLPAGATAAVQRGANGELWRAPPGAFCRTPP